MDHLLFIQLRDCGVLGLLVKDAKEKSARTNTYNRKGDKSFFAH
jgi:hypothetical protein